MFGWPCGPTARFQAMQVTVWTPSPLTVEPARRVGRGGEHGRCCSSSRRPRTVQRWAVASTVTAWLTQRLGFGSFGVRNDTPTGSLSTQTLSVAVLTMPAAFVALRSIWKLPLGGTCERVSTPNDQLTGFGHCCQTESSRGSDGPFSTSGPAMASRRADAGHVAGVQRDGEIIPRWIPHVRAARPQRALSRDGWAPSFLCPRV